MQLSAAIGVDLGGTNVRSAVVLQDGSLVEGTRREFPSHAQSGVEPVFEALAECILSTRAAFAGPLAGVGVAIPGIIDDDAGEVRWAPNFGLEVDGAFRYWENIPFRRYLESRIDAPVVMGNDANLAALGEYAFGVGRGQARCLVMITLGTGIGGGVIFGSGSLQGGSSGPQMMLGGNKGGVELGHILLNRGGLDCNAGSYGALEAYCQRDAVVNRARHKLRRGHKSIVTDWIQADGGRLSPRHLAEAAAAGDELSLQVWRETGAWLGAGVGSLINVFAPDRFALGGQMAHAWDFFAPAMLEEAESVAIPALWRDCQVVCAEKIEDAGLLGAARLALGF